MAKSKNSKMLSFINYRLRIFLVDGRMLVGQMLAFDKHMNLVLADCEEFRKNKRRVPNSLKGAGQVEMREIEEKRTLGLVILRGDTVVSLSVESPPPPERDVERRSHLTTTGPGVGRPAGRGLPMAPGAAGGFGVLGLGGARGPQGMVRPFGAAASAGPMPYRPAAVPAPPPGWRPGMPIPALPTAARPAMPPPGFRPPMPGAPTFPGGRPGMPAFPVGLPGAPGVPGQPQLPPGMQPPPRPPQ